jgi:hypothetical protein
MKSLVNDNLIPIGALKQKNALLCIDTSKNKSGFKTWVRDNLSHIQQLAVESSKEQAKFQAFIDYFTEAGWRKPIFKQITQTSTSSLNGGKNKLTKGRTEGKKYKVRVDGELKDLELKDIASITKINPATLRYRVEELQLPLSEALVLSVGGRAFNARSAPLVRAFIKLLESSEFNDVVKCVALSSDEEYILRHRFAVKPKKSLREIGEEYEVSRERIRQKEVIALQKVNDVYQLVPIDL